MSRGYQDLVAWQKSMDLVESVYHLTESFPKQETYGLTIQIRRAAVSVPSNIAEGQAHYTNADFSRFLRISRGSLAELETQVLIAERLKYVAPEHEKPITAQIHEVSRIISGPINSLQERN
jgi:four helix bundle protein